jgi:hypothetical protein
MAWRHVVLGCLLLALQAAAGQAKLTMIAYMLADNDLQCDMYNNLVVSIAWLSPLWRSLCMLHTQLGFAANGHFRGIGSM